MTGTCTLITGASTGLGKALAEDFAARGEHLVLVARSKSRLEELAAALAANHGVEVVVCCADLSLPGAPAQLYDTCRSLRLQVGRLVNCAGFSSVGDFVGIPPADLQGMVMVNALALAELTRRFLPDMVARRSGTVVNISSLSAFQGVPGMAVYAATKSFVRTLTEALGQELRGTGVRVFAVCPGFLDNDSFYARAGHDRSRILVPVASPQVVVRAVRRGLSKGPTIMVPTLFDRLMVFTQRFLPRPLVVLLAGLFAGASEKKRQ